MVGRKAEGAWAGMKVEGVVVGRRVEVAGKKWVEEHVVGLQVPMSIQY